MHPLKCSSMPKIEGHIFLDYLTGYKGETGIV